MDKQHKLMRTYRCYIKGTNPQQTGVMFTRADKATAKQDFARAFGAEENEVDADLIGSSGCVVEET
jgi:hypothetical protein